LIVRRVLVTGANGFIGNHVCRRLLESGKEVTACIRPQADASLLAAIPGPLGIHRMSSVGGDADLARALSSADAVIHLAGRAHVMRETVGIPLDEFRKVNVGGTENLASLAAQQGVKRFIYMSSIKVNGEATNGHPFRADDPPGYSDPYGQSKWEAEERLRQIAAGTTMQWVVVRPPLVYGPGVRGNFLTLLRAVFRGLPLPLASLQNRRSLVSVFNLSDFVCLLLDHPAAANSRFLVSDQHDLSTPDLLRRIAEALHRPSRILPCPEVALHMAATVLGRRSATQRLCSSLVVDTQKATDSLCWSAPTTLSWGLSRTAEWFLTRVTQ
jgi:nucleoside-diphosphate-sugar epimerase